MRQKWIFFSGFMVIYSLCISQDKAAYIQLYKNIAVSEMLRTGIPASIKLAQGMLESNCGKSDLACKANNHFGIKCGKDWKGKTFKREDDDYEDGKLVKSCFREFSSVYDSYFAHSDFLADPSRSSRYGFLFKLDATDYKAWAKGLSKAGYATDPQYAHRLIDLIEKYELFKFDTPLPEDDLVSSKKAKNERTTFLYHNDVRYAVAQAGDSPLSISNRNDVSVNQVIRYNDDIHDESQMLEAGSRVYLQPKRNSFHGHQKMHLLKPGEDLVTLSQQYGIKLDALFKRNGLEKGEIPAPNQKILLKGKSKKELRTVSPYEIPQVRPQEKASPVISQNATASTSNVIKTESIYTRSESSVSIATQPRAETPEHTVSKGDTLFSISHHYGVSVTDLKKMNNLSADTILIGQKLMLR